MTRETPITTAIVRLAAEMRRASQMTNGRPEQCSITLHFDNSAAEYDFRSRLAIENPNPFATRELYEANNREPMKFCGLRIVFEHDDTYSVPVPRCP